MAIHDEITSAISKHGQWKVRLKNAIDSGKFDGDINSVAKDDQCDFGKWLQGGISEEFKKSADYAAIKELHAKFHKVAAKVAQLAHTGQKAEAEKMIAFGGEFHSESAKLVAALMKWDSSVK